MSDLFFNPMDLPTWANPEEDPIVGYDEAKNPLRRASNGREYLTKPADDQRTTRVKVEDFIDDWIENGKPLPSWEQVSDVIKDIPKETYETIKRQVEGDGTLGDALGTASGVGLGSSVFEVPEGSTRIFGGLKAKKPPLDSLNTDMSDADFVDPAKSFKETGWFFGKDGEPRFEIDDSSAKIFPYDIRGTKKDLLSLSKTDRKDQYDLDKSLRDFSTLDEVLDHPDLYEQYPDLADVPVVIDKDTPARAYVDPYNGYIGINPSTYDDIPALEETILHEVQHLVQDKEGFSPGGSIWTSEVIDRAKQRAKKRSDDYLPEKQKEYDELIKIYNEQEKVDLDSLVKKYSDVYKTLEKEGVYREGIGGYKADSLRKRVEKGTRSGYTLYKFTLEDDDIRGRLATFRETDGKQAYDKVLEALATEDRDVTWWDNYVDNFKFRNPNNTRNIGLLDIPFVSSKPTKPPTRVPSYVSSLRLEDTMEEYKKLSGEAEARQVGRRQKLTPEERRERFPLSSDQLDYPVEDLWNLEDHRKGSSFSDSLLKDINDYLEFNDGGLAIGEDQMRQDPISGNEVPPGSLPEEVRDDVDAKLSEGEYVVPANVVRYFGVKFFEDLNRQAEASLDGMAASGRINGSPEAAGLSPEETAMLQRVMSKRRGTPSGPSGPSGPKMAEGGMVSVPGLDLKQEDKYDQATGFDLSQYSYGNSSSGGSGGVEAKTYINKDLNTVTVLFFSGQPINPIPEGYVEDTPENRKAFTEGEDPGTTQVERDDSKSRPALWEEEGRQEGSKKNYAEMSSEELLRDAQVGLRMGNLLERGVGFFGGSMLGGSMGGAVGAKVAENFLNAGVDSAVANAMIAKARGDIKTHDEILESVFENSKYSSFEEIEANDRLFGRAKDFYNERVGDLPDATTSRTSKVQTTTSGTSSQDSTSDRLRAMDRASSLSGGDESFYSQAETTEGGVATTGGPEGRSATAVRTGSAAPTKTSTRPQARDQVAVETARADRANPGGFDEEEESWGTGPMNKGGLVQKPNKRKRPPNKRKKPYRNKRKGLASKS